MRSQIDTPSEVPTAFEQATSPLTSGVALLFAVACGLAVANVYYAQPMLDTKADDFAIPHSVVGIVITFTQFGYGLGLLLVVPLGDLLNRRLLVVGQSLLSALALIGVATAPNTNVFLFSMTAVGLLAVVTQALVAYAASLAPDGTKGRVVGMVTSGIILGILLARTAAGTLSDLFGWRSVYVVSALATIAVAARLYRSLPNPPRVQAPTHYGELIASVFGLFIQLPVLRVRATLALLIFAALTILLTPLVLPLSSPPFSLSHTQIGLFGLAGAAGALGARRAGHMTDRGRGQKTTGIGLAVMLLSWIPIALLNTSLWFLVLGVIAIDFGLQSVHVANQGLIYRVQPEAQSRLTAAYMLFYSIGSAAGSIVSTWAYVEGGWPAVCTAGALASAAALLFWMATRRLTPEEPDFKPLPP